MTNPQLLSALQELQPESGKRIPDSLITGMTRSLTQARYQLFSSSMNSDGPGFLYLPRGPLPQNIQARRRLMTLPAIVEDNFTFSLNRSLLGGESYPVLSAVLGTAAGMASFGAGLLFTVATTALSISQTSRRVLARAGDELWQVEEIGKNGSTVIHVGSYFLIDPYRGQGANSRIKGWLIHEERTKLDI